MSAPVESTYCSDPAASFTVSSIGSDCAGIQGYYTSEFDAHRVAAYFREAGHSQVSVVPYNPGQRQPNGIHPLAGAFMAGYAPAR
jgi:hypothetical protein